VIKDAVRSWMWERGASEIFPAEILVRDTESGRPAVTGCHGFPVPDVDVAVAHCRELAVAIVRERAVQPPWIRIEESPAERPVLDRDALQALVRNPPDLPARQYLVTWSY
jgi:hypothetical protein